MKENVGSEEGIISYTMLIIFLKVCKEPFILLSEPTVMQNMSYDRNKILRSENRKLAYLHLH